MASLAGVGQAAFAIESVGLLNDTGQTACYGLDYQQVPCTEETTGDGAPLPGQDARFGRDAAAAMGRLAKVGSGELGFDYTRICMSGETEGSGDCPLPPPMPEDVEHPGRNEWACVRDNVTGLTYTLGNLTQATWAEASSIEEGSYIARANSTKRCNLGSGWRLPARREGYSLSSVDRQIPAVDPTYFPLLARQGYIWWTGDTHSRVPIANWAMEYALWADLGTLQCRDVVPNTFCDPPPEETGGRWVASVQLVNGEWRTSPLTARQRSAERWQVRSDGLVVADTATGLIWDRCTWGQSGTDCSGEGQLFLEWTDAMHVAEIANQQRYKGAYDWRVPNVRELETLVKIDAAWPSINSEVFPNTPSTMYWTSSNSWLIPGISIDAWTVLFREGVVSFQEKTVNPEMYPDRSRIRLVRGGQPLSTFDGVSDRLYYADFDGPPSRLLP